MSNPSMDIEAVMAELDRQNPGFLNAVKAHYGVAPLPDPIAVLDELKCDREALVRTRRNTHQPFCAAFATRDVKDCDCKASPAGPERQEPRRPMPDDAIECGRCGHTALWHSDFGRGECQHRVGCACHEFLAALPRDRSESRPK